jgi:hypothetical protein
MKIFKWMKKELSVWGDLFSPPTFSYPTWHDLEMRARKQAYYDCTLEDDFPVVVYTPAGKVTITQEGYEEWFLEHGNEVVDP